jgi:hypothetical protein
MFAIAHLLEDPQLRALGWSQVNQVFGLNPAEAHYSHKSKERLDINGYWKGIEKGWLYAHPDGFGRLGKVRGTLDGTPLDNMFPYKTNADISEIDFAYATEGWAISNRAWMSTVVFSNLGSHVLKVYDDGSEEEVTKPNQGDIVMIRLKAALNLDFEKKETGWIHVQIDDQEPFKVQVYETNVNTGIFEAQFKLDYPAKSKVQMSYGYWGFKKEVEFEIY